MPLNIRQPDVVIKEVAVRPVDDPYIEEVEYAKHINCNIQYPVKLDYIHVDFSVMLDAFSDPYLDMSDIC